MDQKGIAFTIRSVFVIDPKKTIRLILSYPASTGRNTAEVLRVLDSLQTGDKQRVTTPINWVPGRFSSWVQLGRWQTLPYGHMSSANDVLRGRCDCAPERQGRGGGEAVPEDEDHQAISAIYTSAKGGDKCCGVEIFRQIP